MRPKNRVPRDGGASFEETSLARYAAGQFAAAVAHVDGEPGLRAGRASVKASKSKVALGLLAEADRTWWQLALLGDDAAREAARFVASRRPSTQYVYEDALQDARYGVFQAAQRFDPTRGLRFTAWAWYRAYKYAWQALHIDQAEAWGRAGVMPEPLSWVATADPERLARAAEVLLRVRRMPRDTRQSIELWYDGASDYEVVTTLKIPFWLMQRQRDEARSILERKGVDLPWEVNS